MMNLSSLGKRLLPGVLAVVLVAASPIVGPFAAPTSHLLHTFQINQGAVVVQTSYPDCGETVIPGYTNTTGATEYLVGADLWMGLYKGAYADIRTYVRRNSDGMLVAQMMQDRYADPMGVPQQHSADFGAIQLSPGDGLTLYGRNCFVGGVASPMHPIVLLYLEN